MGNEKPASAAPKFEFYNSETGELLGRTAGSWAKITLFYIAYFSFLAGLFTASIQIMKTSINMDKPKLQTRLNIPGLHFFPKVDPESKEQTTRLKENEGVPFFWDSSIETSYKFYSDIVATERTKYNNKTRDVADTESVKTFDWDSNLGECGTGTYGWETSEPCIFLRLNRIIDWIPVGLFQPPKDSFFDADGNKPTKPMVKDAVYMRCNAKYIGEEKPEGEEAPKLEFDYFGGDTDGGDGFVTRDFFPYAGKAAQPNYQSPIAAVKVKGLADGDKHRIRCHAFARNIVIDNRDNLGSISFEIQHKGEAQKTE